MSAQRRSRGFTLLEMLVVLVIMGMTTTILVTGLSTTWQNFKRLGNRDLTVSTVQLPAQWFRTSIQHALLFHPEQPVVKGDVLRLELISSAVPNDARHAPQRMQWIISERDGRWFLEFSAGGASTLAVKSSTKPLRLEYRISGIWKREFYPSDGRLPEAVRVIDGEDIWSMAVPGRPLMADIPAELPIFGDYEF